MKRQITVVLERGKDLFGAYAEDVNGVWGSGETIAETKQSVLDTIRLLKKYNSDENIPEVLKGEYELKYICI